MSLLRRACGLRRSLAGLTPPAVLPSTGLEQPYQGFQRETFVDLPRGTGTGGIADMLAQAGVVRCRWDFLLARVASRRRVLQAGEYRFKRAASRRGSLRPHRARRHLLLRAGRARRPEHVRYRRRGRAARASSQPPRFLDAARDPALIRDLDPQAPTLEGYLFPNTYRLSRHTTPDQPLPHHDRQVPRSLAQPAHRRAGVHHTVTLASLVEKEGKLAEERPRIAAVFENRLRLGMKLDCDPTTIYAALLAAKLSRRHLPLRSG